MVLCYRHKPGHRSVQIITTEKCQQELNILKESRGAEYGAPALDAG
jgi:hypothetical protein